MTPTIIQDKLKGKEDSFFYEGEISSIELPNGTILSLIATGDIRININEDWYDNGNLSDGIEKYKLTDKVLCKLEEEDKLSWENNNWFEVTWLKKGSDCWDCDIGQVAHTYEEALELLKVYAEEDERFRK